MQGNESNDFLIAFFLVMSRLWCMHPLQYKNNKSKSQIKIFIFISHDVVDWAFTKWLVVNWVLFFLLILKNQKLTSNDGLMLRRVCFYISNLHYKIMCLTKRHYAASDFSLYDFFVTSQYIVVIKIVSYCTFFLKIRQSFNRTVSIGTKLNAWRLMLLMKSLNK